MTTLTPEDRSRIESAFLLPVSDDASTMAEAIASVVLIIAAGYACDAARGAMSVACARVDVADLVVEVGCLSPAEQACAAVSFARAFREQLGCYGIRAEGAP